MIRDLAPEGFLAVDLRHVLSALGQRALVSEWQVRDVWATGDATPDLESLTEEQFISGQRLSELAQNVLQIIDGVFSGFDPGVSSPWVVVEAVDSTYYVVRSDEPEVLACIQQTFKNVTPYDLDGGIGP